MKFLLEDSYPRIWSRFNGEPSRRNTMATTLEEYVRPRYWKESNLKPQYKGRQARSHEIQPKLLDYLRIEPKTMRQLSRGLQKSPTAIASGIKALREKGYIIECRASEYYLIE